MRRRRFIFGTSNNYSAKSLLLNKELVVILFRLIKLICHWTTNCFESAADRLVQPLGVGEFDLFRFNNILLCGCGTVASDDRKARVEKSRTNVGTPFVVREVQARDRGLP